MLLMNQIETEIKNEEKSICSEYNEYNEYTIIEFEKKLLSMKL